MNVEYIDHMGSDLTVVNAARVSMDKHHEELDLDTDPKLIRYLARHEHWTPFAHPQVQLRIEAPIFVANQLKRHQIGFALNEISRRYVKDPPEYHEVKQWRLAPDKSVKQGSGADANEEQNYALRQVAGNLTDKVDETYRNLIDDGIAPEQARALLPMSMHTSWYWTGSLYAWARLCGQRLDPHAQGETQWIAREIDKIISPLFLHSWPILLESTRVRMAAHDMRALLKKWVATGLNDEEILRQRAEELLERIA